MSYHTHPWKKYYPPGIPDNLRIPDISLIDGFNRIAELYPNQPALHFLGSTLSYRQLLQLSHQFAHALIREGVQQGDLIGINLPNLPQFLIALLGAFKAGCRVSPISPLASVSEMKEQILNCRAKILVTYDTNYKEKVFQLAPKLPSIKKVIVTRPLDSLPSIKQLLARLFRKLPFPEISPLPKGKMVLFFPFMEGCSSEDPLVHIDPRNTAVLQYTGGTTGVPKGVVLSHHNLVANIHQSLPMLAPEEGKEVGLSVFPFFHSAGLICALTALLTGGCQVLIPNPRDLDHVIREIKKYQPTLLFAIPLFYEKMLDKESFRALDFSRLKFALSGGTAFPSLSIKRLQELIGNRVLEGYGMTEAGPAITCSPPDFPIPGSAGIPLPLTDIRIVDLQQGKSEVPVGEAGELIVRGPQVMRKYWNHPQETQKVLRIYEGKTWLFTGDIAKMTSEGYIIICDRLKDMINVNGFKVFPRDVENQLLSHPAIQHCAIIGVSDPQQPGSEKVKLVVELAKDYSDRDPSLLKEMLLQYCQEQMAPYKKPGFIEFVEALPLTPLGKVDKRLIHFFYGEDLKEGAC
ncbi:MAG: hypothetical protein COB67_06150 [SAR324 cluster bacterium]|uniref:Long-chain fatty acid--CoA ligase n=1 Tax=SAR324 cluster bacterium TaxID=2024889 RepID=A0A2A4T6C2_9DELT|nr:MAG: hypothetical protein COB67_06150 [SAR324 cluster bacterium]